MDSVLAAGIVAAIAGVLTGFAAGLSFRFSEREQGITQLRPESAFPPGAARVLSVLRSSAVVLDDSDTVVKASSAAYALGLVRGDRLAFNRLLAMAHQVRRDGEIREQELDLAVGKRREPLAVSARVAPLGARHVLVLVDDRTESRRIEAVRRDFIANVSHELKTPIGALALLAEAMHSASDDPQAVRHFADRMTAESDRLTKIIQELIDLSRLQAPDPNQIAEPVLVDEVVDAAIERTRATATAKSIAIATGGEHGLKVRGDETQLATALGNIVENAVNYSAEHTRVAIGVARSGGIVEIAVTDQGIGIPDAERDRIFERFYRVDPARSRATGGTGLGLSIVKHVVQNHGGDVRVWSVEGAGSTFTIRLPLSDSPERTSQSVQEAAS